MKYNSHAQAYLVLVMHACVDFTINLICWVLQGMYKRHMQPAQWRGRSQSHRQQYCAKILPSEAIQWNSYWLYFKVHVGVEQVYVWDKPNIASPIIEGHQWNLSSCMLDSSFLLWLKAIQVVCHPHNSIYLFYNIFKLIAHKINNY